MWGEGPGALGPPTPPEALGSLYVLRISFICFGLLIMNVLPLSYCLAGLIRDRCAVRFTLHLNQPKNVMKAHISMCGLTCTHSLTYHPVSAVSVCCIRVLHQSAASVCCISVLHRCAASVCCISVLHRCAASVCCIGVLHRCAASVFCISVLHQCSTSVCYISMMNQCAASV